MQVESYEARARRIFFELFGYHGYIDGDKLAKMSREARDGLATGCRKDRSSVVVSGGRDAITQRGHMIHIMSGGGAAESISIYYGPFSAEGLTEQGVRDFVEACKNIEILDCYSLERVNGPC